MTKFTIENGSSVYQQEVRRIQEEKELAAQELAEQLVQKHKESAEQRTTVALILHFTEDRFNGNAAKYFRCAEVTVAATKILAEHGWSFKATPDPEGDGDPLFELKPLQGASS